MFPLGSVLFPHMPLPLRVFEERYMVMLSRILPDEPSEFGVVLIERGQEVGGGEKRFTIGTVAQIQQLDANEDFVVLVAQGERRIEILEWLEEDPHPVARVRDLPELEWRGDLLPLREKAEEAVRRTLRVAGSQATSSGRRMSRSPTIPSLRPGNWPRSLPWDRWTRSRCCARRRRNPCSALSWR